MSDVANDPVIPRAGDDWRMKRLRDLLDLIDLQARDIDSLYAGFNAELEQANAVSREFLVDPQYVLTGARQIADYINPPGLLENINAVRDHYSAFKRGLRRALAAIDKGEPLPDGGERMRAAMEKLAREKAAA